MAASMFSAPTGKHIFMLYSIRLSLCIFPSLAIGIFCAHIHSSISKMQKIDYISLNKVQNLHNLLRHLTFWICLFQVIFRTYFEQLCIRSGDIELHPGPPPYVSMCHLNIRSLSHDKVLSLQHQLANIYDIIALTETFLNSDSKHDLNINNYHAILRKDRPTPGGGVAVYISNNYLYKRRQDLEIANIECLWVEIRSNNNKFLLAVCYRPPNADSEFWEYLQYMVDLAYQDQTKHIILTGDLNADPRTRDGVRLEQFCNASNLTIHINSPTRVTENSSTILDQFLTNIPDAVVDTNVLAPLSTNDHSTITLTLSFKKQKSKAYNRLIWLYNSADFEGMNKHIQNYNWETCFEDDDIDTCCNNWTASFLNIARQFIPNKVVQIRPNDAAWFNSELRKLKRQKDRAHSKAKTSHKAEDWLNFRSIRNNYTNKIREAEKNYKENLATSLKNSQNIDPNEFGISRNNL